MAGHKINFSDGSVAYVDYADAEGRAVVNGRVWRWARGVSPLDAVPVSLPPMLAALPG